MLRWHNQIGLYDVKKRMFRITLGDCVLQDKVDVLALAGARLTALNLYFPVQVKGNDVYFNGKPCHGGYSSGSKTIGVSFVPLGIDNPMVSGIILFKGTVEGGLTRDRQASSRRDSAGVRSGLRKRKAEEGVREVLRA
jgi:hypothetical protein